jgi:hypothetical protein
MKRLWKIVGIGMLVTVLGVVTVGAVAYAQDGEDGSEWPFNFREKVNAAVADILGISVEEYDSAVDQAQEQVVGEALAEGWLTEDQAERMQERMDQGFGGRGMDKGLMGPHMGFKGRGGTSLVGAAADELDMSVQDLLAELQDGKSIADVANEKGVDAQAIADAYLTQLEEHLTQAVEDGKITQKLADSMLEQARETVPEQLENTWEDFGPGKLRGGRRPGRMGDFPGQSDS